MGERAVGHTSKVSLGTHTKRDADVLCQRPKSLKRIFAPCAGITQIRFRRSVADCATLSAWRPKLPLRSVSIRLSLRDVPCLPGCVKPTPSLLEHRFRLSTIAVDRRPQLWKSCSNRITCHGSLVSIAESLRNKRELSQQPMWTMLQ